MQAFILAILVKAVENPKIRAFILEFAQKLGAWLLPQLAALIPAAAAAAGTVLLNKLPSLIPGLSSVPLDLPAVVNEIHNEVNKLLPDDVDIPVLSDVVQNLTGIDLSNWLKGL